MSPPGKLLLVPVPPKDVPKKIHEHSLASIFPLMVGAPFEGFVADIQARGLIHPMILYEGKLLDGRNRERGCRAAGVAPRFVRYIGDKPQDFVISLNLERRHLSTSQRSMCAGRVANFTHGGDRSKGSIDLLTLDQAAERFKVSPPSVKRARIVLAKGAMELAAAVDHDSVPVSAASRIIKELPDHDQQRALVKRVEVDHVKPLHALRDIGFEAKKKKDAAQTRASVVVPTVRKQLAVDFIKSFKPATVDLGLTDPPYATDIENIEAFAAEWLPLFLSRIKPTGRAYVCIGAYPRELAAYLDAAAKHGWMPEQILPWVYRNTLGPAPTHKYKQNWQAILYWVGPKAPPLDCPVMTEQFAVQDINAPDGRLGDRFHAWQKPDELAERLVRHSTKPGDLVIDPFVCTGTFVIAAAKLGRKAMGSDISAENLKIAVGRGCRHER